MKNSRTKNSAINVIVSSISKVMTLVLSFACRTFFIQTLGKEYLGVNGLFSNILTILSFAELGIGNAIIFKLYKPIAEEDKTRIKSLLHFYKKAYFVIGIFIIFAGVSIIPFLGLIVKNAPEITESLTSIYILFLANTAISYFFTYKKSIIIGNQKEYIINFINFIVMAAMNIIQIVLLLMTHNYMVYLCIQLVATIADNVIMSIIAEKKYPYIKDKTYEKISKLEQKNIFNDVKSLVLYKLGYVLANGTDNIIISSFIGVAKVGLLSNYTIVTSSVKSLINAPFNSITASIGNLNTIKEVKKKEQVFYDILYLSFLVYGFVSIGIAILINRFIHIWLGPNYILSFSIAVTLALDLYVDGMRYISGAYRNTLGIFKKGRMMPLISSVSNVVLSIILVKPLGIFGVLVATVITRLMILTWYDPYLIHKYEFKTSCKKYYWTYSYYFIILIITIIIAYLIDSSIRISGILGLILSGMATTAVILVIFFTATVRSNQFINLKSRFFKKGDRR